MITGDANFVIESSSGALYRYNTVHVLLSIVVATDLSVAADMQVWDSATSTVFYGSATARFSSATVNGYSSGRGGETEIFAHCVEQAVADHLDALTGNASVTFTVT